MVMVRCDMCKVAYRLTVTSRDQAYAGICVTLIALEATLGYMIFRTELRELQYSEHPFLAGICSRTQTRRHPGFPYHARAFRIAVVIPNILLVSLRDILPSAWKLSPVQ